MLKFLFLKSGQHTQILIYIETKRRLSQTREREREKKLPQFSLMYFVFCKLKKNHFCSGK